MCMQCMLFIFRIKLIFVYNIWYSSSLRQMLSNDFSFKHLPKFIVSRITDFLNYCIYIFFLVKIYNKKKSTKFGHQRQVIT